VVNASELYRDIAMGVGSCSPDGHILASSSDEQIVRLGCPQQPVSQNPAKTYRLDRRQS